MQNDTQKKINTLVEVTESVYLILGEMLPDGPEKSNAITKLQECVMWANQGICQEGVRVEHETARDEAN